MGKDGGIDRVVHCLGSTGAAMKSKVDCSSVITCGWCGSKGAWYVTCHA